MGVPLFFSAAGDSVTVSAAGGVHDTSASRPLTVTVTSVGVSGAEGSGAGMSTVAGVEGSDTRLWEFFAVTVTVCCWPVARPVRVHSRPPPSALHICPPGAAVAVYSTMGEPAAPVSVGAVQVIRASPLPAVTVSAKITNIKRL